MRICRPWTAPEDEIIRTFYAALGPTKLCEQLPGRTYGAIGQRATRFLGLHVPEDALEPGRRFDQWTVLGKSNRPRSGSGCVFYRCRCSCGKVKDVSSTSLRTKHSSSCGHVHRERFLATPQDVWTPEDDELFRIHYPTGGAAKLQKLWPTRMRSAIHRHATELELLRPWTAKEDAHVRKHYRTKGGPYVLTKVDRSLDAVHQRASVLGVTQAAAKRFSPEENALIEQLYPVYGLNELVHLIPNKNSVSIYQRTKKLGLYRVYPVHPEVMRALTRYRSGARAKGQRWALTEPEFFHLVEGCCHYCGIAPTTRRATKRAGVFYMNGIDRKDNRKGYIPDNCVSCCMTCNFLKKDTPYLVFKAWISRIAKHNADAPVFTTRQMQHNYVRRKLKRQAHRRWKRRHPESAGRISN